MRPTLIVMDGIAIRRSEIRRATVLTIAYVVSVVTSFGGLYAGSHHGQCRDHYSLYDTGKVVADAAVIMMYAMIPVVNIPMAAWLTDGFPHGFSFHLTADCADAGGKA